MRPEVTILWENKANCWFICPPLNKRVIGSSSLIETFKIAFNQLLIGKTEKVRIENGITGATWYTDFETVIEDEKE